MIISVANKQFYSMISSSDPPALSVNIPQFCNIFPHSVFVLR
jgi:hypothetical protein